jgi:hypothetical protein
MVRADADHVNWVLVVILAALALLLAMVSSSASPHRAKPAADWSDVDSLLQQRFTRSSPRPGEPVAAGQESIGSERLWTVSEGWYVGCELYRAGRFAQARWALERVVNVLPDDAAARTWAGMATLRAGDPAGAIRQWEPVWTGNAPGSEPWLWSGVAMVAVHLEAGSVDDAARIMLRLEDEAPGAAGTGHAADGPRAGVYPIISFYAARVYEALASEAADYRDAVEEPLRERFSPVLAAREPGVVTIPNSRSWLTFLAKRALKEAVRGAGSIDWSAPVVAESATVEPSLAPTVEELLEAIGSADFAVQARGKLRALEIYESQPEPEIEIFDTVEPRERNRRIA